MKNILNFKYLFLFLFVTAAAFQPLFAQGKAEGKNKMEALLESGEFMFKARSASPLRGSMIQLTSEYDIVVSKDSVETFLPYFGRAHAMPSYGGEGGIKITSTDFNYNVEDKRKKRWNIVIEPNDERLVQQLILNVSESGFATLRVISTNKDPISFNGYVTPRS